MSQFAKKVDDFTSGNKLAIALFAINLGVILIAYSVYLVQFHFSDDTFVALSPHNLADTNLNNGRVFHFLIYSALDAVGFDLPRHIRITQLMLSIVCAYGTSALARRFFACLKQGTVAQLVMLDGAMVLTIANPYFLSGWFYWPESCAGASVAVLCTFLAAVLWCKSGKTWGRKIACLLLVVISGCMYQVYLEFFLGIAVTFSLMEHSFKVNRRLIFDLVCIVVWCAIAAAVSYLVMVALTAIGGVTISRMSLGSSVSWAEKLESFWASQEEVAIGLNEMLPNGFLVTLCSLLCVGAIFLHFRNKRPCRVPDIVVFVACFLGIYITCYIPQVLSQNEMVPRLYAGLFTLPVLFAGFFASESNSAAKAQWVGAALVSIALVVSIAHMIGIEADTIRCNELDNSQLETICRVMDDYEDRTGRTVDDIRYCCDSSRGITAPGIHRVYDVNNRCMPYFRHFKWAMADQLGGRSEKVSISEMDDRERALVFGNKNWDWFDPSEQVLFDGSTMYVAIY